MKQPAPIFSITLLLAVCFTLATWLQPVTAGWNQARANNQGLMAVTFGDARRLFAKHFFIKADVYFHSGYYPSIFDQAARQEVHIAEEAGHHEKDEHEDEINFLGKPHDWIESFGRNFFKTEHTELSGGKVDEMLPWLRIAAELDPEQVETYTVAAYFLRTQVKKPAEAEQFLREGLRANPDSYEILFTLGQIYADDYHNPSRARNLWELAVRCWHQREDGQQEPDYKALHDIATQLANLEEQENNYARAIEWKEVAKPYSPAPDVVQSQIDELREKLAEQKK